MWAVTTWKIKEVYQGKCDIVRKKVRFYSKLNAQKYYNDLRNSGEFDFVDLFITNTQDGYILDSDVAL